MPAASESTENLMQELRTRVGYPDEGEQTDAELRRLLDAALRELNAAKPLSRLGSFATVGDQSSYDVVPADAYEVEEVYYYPCGSAGEADPFRLLNLTDVFGYDVLAGGVGAGARLFDNPSLAVAFHKKAESYRQDARGRWVREIEDGTIWLAPTPCCAGTVFFRYSGPRFASLAVLKKPWERLVLARAEVSALEAMAHKRSHITGSSMVGNAFTTGGGKVQIDMARQKLEQWNREVHDMPGGHWVG